MLFRGKKQGLVIHSRPYSIGDADLMMNGCFSVLITWINQETSNSCRDPESLKEEAA